MDNSLAPTAPGALSTTAGHWSQRDLLALYLTRFDRPQTQRAYRNDLAQFFGVDIVTFDQAKQVSFVSVNEHLQMMEREGLRPSTMKRRIAAVRGFFDWLVALQLLEHNPANRQLVRRIRNDGKNDRPIVFLSTKQAKRLLDAALDAGESAQRDHALLQVLLHCVLRRSEAAGMCFEHLQEVGDYWIVSLPSTKGGTNQFVKLPEHVHASIMKMARCYGYNTGALWRSLSKNDSRGNPLSASGVYEVVKRTAARAGLTGDIGAHTLRHTGCTLALEAGATLQQVQTHARHKHVETTMRYVHQRDKLKNSAADFIELRDQGASEAG